MKRIVESHYPGALEKNLTLSKERWLVLQGCFCRHRSQLTINILTLLSCVLAASIVHMYQSAYGHVDFNFATVGDFGCTANTNATVTNIRDKNPELVLALGDYSYAYTADCWLDRIQSLNNITKINIGNHEDEISDGFDEYMNHFGLTEPYYSYDYQNVHVLTMTFETSYSIGNPQYDFVVSDLQSASQNASIDWIVVNLHDWVYRASSSNPLYNDFAVIYHPLFDKYDVDLVLSGHSHNYHRTYPLKYNPNNPTSPLIIDNDTNDYIDPRGQVYAVVGTGGINLHPIIGSSQFVASNQDDFFGQLDIKFTNNGGKLEGRFYRNGDNAVLDIFSITKSRVTGSGTYHYTPSLALTGSNYNDTRSSSSLQLSQFSAAAWFKTSAIFSSNAFIVNKGGIGSDNRGNNMNYGIWMTSSEKIRAGFETSSGADHFVTTTGTYNDNQWHYVMVTYDGSSVILYIDGTQVDTKSTLGASPESSGTKPVRVGANSGATPPDNFFTGNVDEVRV